MIRSSYLAYVVAVLLSTHLATGDRTVVRAASTANKVAAKKCTSVGTTRVISGTRHICVVLGKNRVWIAQSGAAATTTTTTSTSTSTTTTTTTTTVPTADQIRPGNDLTRMNLRGINLSGKDLSTVRAPFADLTDANLSGAFVMSLNLASATLKNANLSRSRGGWLYLNGANLEGANLSGASLPYSNFDAHVLNDIVRVNLRSANLAGAELRGSTFENADFTGANARGADLSSANFQKAILRNSNFTDANFRGADLGGADLTGSTLGSDWRTRFEGAMFRQTTWVDGTVWSTTPTGP